MVGAFCDPSSITWVQGVAAAGLACTIAIVGLAYMLGEFLKNARVLVWARTELLQVGVSLIITLLLVQTIIFFCGFSITDIAKSVEGDAAVMTSLAAIGGSTTDNAFTISENFMLWQIRDTSRTLGVIRYISALYELRSTQSDWDCPLFCLLGATGRSSSPQSGETSFLGVTGMLMNSMTVALLSEIFQLFTLKYIESGMFLLLLPAGVILRSVPFMRPVGGTLIAIVVAMFILYPLLLSFEALFWPSFGPNIPSGWSEVFDKEKDLKANPWNPTGPCKVDEFDQLNVLGAPEEVYAKVSYIFLAATFLPAVNFIIIAAGAHTLSRMIGEDIDISRLGQMV